MSVGVVVIDDVDDHLLYHRGRWMILYTRWTNETTSVESA